jgi:hypothetical protein
MMMMGGRGAWKKNAGCWRGLWRVVFSGWEEWAEKDFVLLITEEKAARSEPSTERAMEAVGVAGRNCVECSGDESFLEHGSHREDKGVHGRPIGPLLLAGGGISDDPHSRPTWGVRAMGLAWSTVHRLRILGLPCLCLPIQVSPRHLLEKKSRKRLRCCPSVVGDGEASGECPRLPRWADVEIGPPASVGRTGQIATSPDFQGGRRGVQGTSLTVCSKRKVGGCNGWTPTEQKFPPFPQGCAVPLETRPSIHYPTEV